MFTPLFRVSERPHNLPLLTRQLDAFLFDLARPRSSRERAARGPAFDVFDDGEQYRLVADLPGLSADDLEVEATEDGLAVRGTRRVEVPEGFAVRRREREGLRLAQSFTFPTKVDPDQVAATLDQGVLTITLAKRADQKPRSITVRRAVA
ncbi:MAG: Hsp20/alpha crystallin family protein [Myxococcota bacterium]